MRIGQLGNRAIIDAMALEDDKPHSISVPLSALAATSAFPLSLSTSVGEGESKESGEGKGLQDGFASSDKMEEVVKQYKEEVIQRFIPGLVKDGYQERSVRAAWLLSACPSGLGSSPR